MNLTGKRAVVTGGAMGIGLATARRLLDAGASVALWDLNATALRDAATTLAAPPGRLATFVCDVTDKHAVAETARETERVLGPVDILVNNAGMVRGGTLLEGSEEEWEKTIAVNLTALVYTIRAFLPGMHERNAGHVVNISSAAGLIGVGGLAVYSATKWGVVGLTESLRFESWNAGKRGVRWSTIHPSYLAAGMFEGARLGLLGNLIVPLVRNHDVIARAIVEGALKRGKYSPKRPITVHLTPRLRAFLPDPLFQRVLVLLGVHRSMSHFRGRTHA
jgi:all-trans-retinol dehydrogenase (NAD+)